MIHRKIFTQAFDIEQDVGGKLQTEEPTDKIKEQSSFDQDRLYAILENLPSAVTIIEASTNKLSYLNRRARELYGFDHVGVDLDTYMSKINALKKNGLPYRLEETPFNRSLKYGRTIRNEKMAIKRPDGMFLPLLVSSSPLFDYKGKIIAAIVVFEDFTRQRQASELLRESEERFRALVTASSETLYSMSPDWSKMRYLYGKGFLADTESPSLSWFQKYVLPEEQPRVTAAINEAIRKKNIFELEYRVRREDGSTGWAFSRAVPLLNRQGEIVEWFGAARDITRRKQAEEALRESEARQAFLLQLADEFRQMNDATELQQTACRLLRKYLTAHCVHFAGLNDEGGIFIDGPDFCREALSGQENRNQLAGFAETLALYNGITLAIDNIDTSPMLSERAKTQCREINIQSFVTVPLVKNGILTGILSVFSKTPHTWKTLEISLIEEVAERTWDAVERIRAQTALKKAHDELEQIVAKRTAELAQANEKYRLLVNNTPHCIFSYDNKFRHTFVNRTVCRIYGLEEYEIIGKTYRDLGFPEEVIRKMEEVFNKVLAGNTVEEEITFSIPDGSIRTFWFVMTTVLDENKNITSITGTARDLTEYKLLEEELLKKDKLDAIGILAGGIAHDFNNYLAMVLTNINLAKLYSDDTKKILEKLENIEKATLRAKDLSNQLFTFSRGGAPLKKKIPINQLIVENIEFALSGAHILPRFYIAEDLQMVEADKSQLSQVLNNIAINAVQAMPDGGTLEVRAENVFLSAADSNYFIPLPDGPYIKITIKDEGTGIPAEYLSKIFDPFFTTKDNGRGLGLAIAYSIIKKHGGHLHVESEIHKGTSFYIFLPAVAPPETNPAARHDVFKGTGKILVMDDEEDLLNVTGEALSALGFDVSLAREGKEAIEQYVQALNKGHPFDLVILDLTIQGGMGGRQTIKELLKIDPAVKAIVASGYSNAPVMAEYQDYIFKGALQKPFTIETLSRVVYEAMA